MGVLTEAAQWAANVFKIDTDTVWKGGDDGDANKQGQALANRTSWLKEQVEALELAISNLFSASDYQKATAITADAGGTADAITAAFNPVITALTHGMTLYVRAAFANATTTPTFTPHSDTIEAKTIVKGAGAALAAGDIAGGGHWIELQYDLTLDKWVLLNPATGVSVAAAATVQASFKNLKLSAAGTNNAITATIDEVVLENASSQYMTIRGISGASVAVGSGSGAWNGTTMLLDTGSWASSTWYSVWVISTPEGAANWLFSLSATAPTMPSGYTFKARIGWIRTDGTGNKYPLSMVQMGRRAQYKVAAGTNVTSIPQMASGVQGSISTPTFVAVSTGNFVPPTASEIIVSGVTLTSGDVVMAAPSAAFGAGGSLTNPVPLLVNTMTASSVGLVGEASLLLESSSIYVAQSAANCRTVCVGWVDNI